jgi:hypothetical protein
MAYALIAKALFQATKFGARTGGRIGGAAAKTIYANRGAIWQSGIVRPARAIYGTTKTVGGFAFRHPTPLIIGGAVTAGAFNKGRTASENLMGAAVEGTATAAGMGAWGIGATVGAAFGTAVLPGIGTAVGGFIGGFLASGGVYGGIKAIGKMGYGKKSPEYGEFYLNERALTMRQASMMALAKSQRNPFGREASVMHLR